MGQYSIDGTILIIIILIMHVGTHRRKKDKLLQEGRSVFLFIIVTEFSLKVKTNVNTVGIDQAKHYTYLAEHRMLVCMLVHLYISSLPLAHYV